MDRQGAQTTKVLPACLGMDEAARVLGLPAYYLPWLMRAGHRKPLGKPAQNARKWFATVELERLGNDADWLDTAVRIVEKRVHEANKKQRSKDQIPAPRADLDQRAA